jgi:glycerophosphoryl diester phosphodiesterase
MESRVLVWCQSALAVRYVARMAPAIETAYLKDLDGAQRNHGFIARAKRLGAKAVSAYWRAIDARFVEAAHALGLRVYSWHAAFPLEPPGLTAGLDGLITDYPREARKALVAVDAPRAAS